MSDISFVILNYNGYKETVRLIESLMKWDRSNLDFNIVIVDNCSSDDSFDRLRADFNQIEYIDVIKSWRNGGYSYGNNFGARYTIEKYNPKYIAISNPDVELEQDMVVKLIETFLLDDRIAICAPIMKALDGSYSIFSENLPTFEYDFRACFLWSKATTTNKDYSILYNENNIITEMVPGSFFVIRADYFVEIGMFDENVFLYCEERILGKRLKNLGYLSIKRADLFFVHAHAVTTSRSISALNRWKILLNSRLYYEKTYEKIKGWRLLLLKTVMKIYLFEIWLLFKVKRA